MAAGGGGLRRRRRRGGGEGGGGGEGVRYYNVYSGNIHVVYQTTFTRALLHQLPLCQLQECSHSISLAILTLSLIVLFSWALCHLPDLIFSTLVHTRIILRVYWYRRHLHAREAHCCLPTLPPRAQDEGPAAVVSPSPAPASLPTRTPAFAVCCFQSCFIRTDVDVV